MLTFRKLILVIKDVLITLWYALLVIGLVAGICVFIYYAAKYNPRLQGVK